MRNRKARLLSSISSPNIVTEPKVPTIASPKKNSSTLAPAELLRASRYKVKIAMQVAAAPIVASTTAVSSTNDRRCSRAISSSIAGVVPPVAMAAVNRSIRSATRARRPANTFNRAAMPDRRKTGVSATCIRCTASFSEKPVAANPGSTFTRPQPRRRLAATARHHPCSGGAQSRTTSPKGGSMRGSPQD